MMKKRYVFSLIGLICLLTLTAAPVRAASLTELQIQAIISLLSSFGADQAAISNVTEVLTGQATAGSASSACLSLTQNLYAGQTDSSTNGEVSQLQQFLGITPTTGYFGPLTEQAVQNWQATHGVVFSGSPNTTGYGSVGPLTRASMECEQVSAQSAATSPSAPATGSQSPSTVSASQNSVPAEPPSTVSQSQSTSPVPTISSFSASPGTVSAGQSTTLSWSASDATSISISGIGTVSGSSLQVSPSQTTTYTLTATNASGSATAQTTVTVASASSISSASSSAAASSPAPTCSLTSNPSSLTQAPNNVMLSWSSANATSGTITGIGSVGTAGSQTISLAQTTTYTGLFTGAGGTGTCQTTVTVTAPTPGPTISSFSASPGTVSAGQSATLSWSVSNATSLSIDNGIGTVTGSSITVSPTQTTTYTLTATNSAGSASAQATVTVTVPAPTCTASINPTSGSWGSATTVTWNSQNATALSLNWYGQTAGVGLSGSRGTSFSSAIQTLVFTATGPGGTGTCSVSIPAEPSPGS